MSKKDSSTETIEAEGVVKEVLPGLEYLVEIDYKGIKHNVKCYVSGKMRSNYIQISKGDQVKVEISLYDINTGRITYRLSKPKIEKGPPRRPKK